ncbi:uncharacterized protein LOC115879390 [Sitophilus oryzae]|uniref:Uncharacterized protein LOC115879390 n=1 Tax=Sitophilus oryzae TaxID=7048 RepID=A0A6J2XLX0_SITOR|nr:uncharacterized protein LOC115879390 [Sitophilus oryzae]
MPVETSLSSILTTRFDFGVPLEDIFPPGDVHSRLKFLFVIAYNEYRDCSSDIEDVLKYSQGSLQTRFDLKDKLILDIDYRNSIQGYPTGSYFWLLRHFLGLLPLPLLPTYTNGCWFDWVDIGEECRYVLKYFRGGSSSGRHRLDQEIADSMNMLPWQNLILLDLLVKFIRKICCPYHPNNINKESLITLGKFFCGSVLLRPYTPGNYTKNDTLLSLFLYIILRWKNLYNGADIAKDDNNNPNSFSNFNITSIYQRMPIIASLIKSSLKEAACQTETSLSSHTYCDVLNSDSANLQGSKDFVKKSDQNLYKLTFIEEEPEEVLENEDENDCYQTAIDFTLKSGTEERDVKDWSEVLQETLDTVRKVEEGYIYDDYETFNKEKYNQVGETSIGTVLNKISKQGWTYISSKSTPLKKSSTPKTTKPEEEDSYLKFPDPCDGIDFESSTKCTTKHVYLSKSTPIKKSSTPKNKPGQELSYAKFPDPCDNIQLESSTKTVPPAKSDSRVSEKLFQDSPATFVEDNSNQNLENRGGTSKRSRYVLKRMRLSLEFLRTLSPKRSVFNKVKYQKI